MVEARDTIQILLVDDEPELADLTTTYLERENDRFSTETAASVSEGLDRLSDREFDCLISDYDMPGQNGIEFPESVREEYPDIPFILYTGKGSEEVASEAISAGVTDYLQKEAGTSQYTVLANRIHNAVERYRSRQAVEQTEQKLSQLAERTDDVLFMFDGDWSELLFLNSAFEDIWGMPVERVEENPVAFIERIHPEDRDKARRSMERLSKGRPDEIEYRVVPPDGDQRWVRGQTKPVFDDDGAVTRIVGFVRDITDEKERTRRFEATFNNTYTFVGLMEPDGTLIEANDTALSFGGLNRDDVVGQPLWETYWVQSSEETQRIVREGVEHARNGGLFRDEIRVQGSDREAVIDFSIRPVTNEHGEVTLLVPEGRDITDRKREEDKRQQIIDRVTDAIVEVDANWTFTLVNEQAAELCDMAEEDLLGRDFREVFQEARDTRFEEEYRRVMETRQPASFVEYVPQLDGWFDIEAYPKEDGGIAFYFVEVTEQKRRERQLRRKNRRLEEFASVVSHDLRNPLRVADGRVELLRKECESDHVDDVAQALDRMDALIEDLLTLARDGERIGEVEPVGLAAVVEDCWQHIAATEAEMVTDCDRTVRADRSRLQQLVENLLRNAVEHGGENVTITVGDLDEGFYLEDDGPGIPRGTGDDVFEAGYSTSDEGTGFGLSIVRQVAEAHGWNVGVTEGANGGARFEITGVETVSR